MTIWAKEACPACNSSMKFKREKKIFAVAFVCANFARNKKL